MKNNINFLKAKGHLVRIIGKNNVADDPVAIALNAYDCSSVKTPPFAVLNIRSCELLPKVINILNRFNIPFVPRMSATNHCGGCVPIKNSCVLNLAPLDKILNIDVQNLTATVEPGVINKNLQDKLAPYGLAFAPDPASMAFSTIGGNAALNAGGSRTLKYGATLANILKAEIILPDGQVKVFDSADIAPGLLPLFVHAEGTLGIITKLWLKLIIKPAKTKLMLACFASLQDTMTAVSQIIAAGIVPCALEAMDKITIAATKTDLPPETEAVLIIEFDGKDINKEMQTALKICKQNDALTTIEAQDDIQKQQLWAKRQNACSALSALAPNVIALDSTVPRSHLAAALTDIRAILDKYHVRSGLVFHAGDGNMHPNIFFDERNLFEVSLIKKAVKEINASAIKYGGTVTGEHGIGVEKRAAMGLMFSQGALNLLRKIKHAFDAKNLANPDKILPVATQSSVPITVPNVKLAKVIEQIKNNYANEIPTIIAGTKSKFKTKIALDISALNNITDIDTGNYTVTIEAATTFKRLEQALREKQMFLPFSIEKGTVGGAFASKTFDGFADMITAVQFILPDGTLIDIGGKYVKNAAGYELIKLLHGSFGAYALLTKFTIRTFAAKPAAVKTNAFKFFEPNDITAKLKGVFDDKNLFNPFIFEGFKND